MAAVLEHKVSLITGTLILATVASYFSVSIINSTFTKTYDNLEVSQKAQLDLIKKATGEDLNASNVDNWNVYSNLDYGFSIKYPGTLAEIKDENKKAYSEEYFGTQAQFLKISFENFTIKVWKNPKGLELKDYLASDEFCSMEKVFCLSFKKMGEAGLLKTAIADKNWFQAADSYQRFFIFSLDNKYFLDFELTNLKSKEEFSKIITTLEFI